MKAKRILPLLLAFAMFGGAFAGCSNSGGKEHEEHSGGTATCTKKAVCTVCGEEYGELAAHSYTAETAESKYLKSAATCTQKAVYYKSCSVCGATGTETFESGELAAHSYTAEVAESKYLKSAATTTAKAVYYKSCSVCGLASETETFEYGEVVEETKTDTSFKIYVVGDSTVCSFNDNYYLPRYGYGTQLAEYFNVSSDQIVNLALSGRSSKSFLSEDNYTTLKNSISSGDYLIIGFGHNDEKSAEPARFTDPNGTISEGTTSKGTSLKWNINEYYIKLAKEKGATPILCTPIVRYSSTADYSADKAHITSDGDYPTAIKELGEETETAVIDLTALTKAEYLTDNDAAIYYHAHSTYAGDIKTAPASGDIYDGSETPDGRDDTHINMYGAKMVAYKFATALASTDCSLKNYVKASITAPTKAADYVAAINQKYVKTAYETFVAADHEANLLGTTTTNSTTVSWYKTAMGQLGGDTKVTSYSTTYSATDGKFTLVTDKGSKFASSQDGFGAAFVQISVSKNFTSSAHIKVTAFTESNVAKQAGFGMMLRDDILIDTNDATLASNYVAAGLQTVDGGDPFAIWSRASGTMTKESSNTTSYAVDSEYDVSITRVGQTVTVTFADGKNTYTKTYTDFDFVARDTNYMYLCLFAARGFTVEFTNVSFEITGESQGA